MVQNHILHYSKSELPCIVVKTIQSQRGRRLSTTRDYWLCFLVYYILTMDCLLYNWLTDRQGSTSIVYQSIKYREGRKQAKNTFLLLELQSHFERDKCQCKEQYVIDSLIRNVNAMLHYTYLKYYRYHKIFSIYITLIFYNRKYVWPINEVRLVFFHMRLLILYI